MSIQKYSWLIKRIILWVLIFSTFSSRAQVKLSVSQDTAIRFKVFGVCVMCKDRIEGILKVKGVKTASWDIESKQLSLLYNPALISLDKIENRIVAIGHDLENKKAKNIIYSQLPPCCHYREIDKRLHEAALKDSGSAGLKDSAMIMGDSNAIAISTSDPGNDRIKETASKTEQKGLAVPAPDPVKLAGSPKKAAPENSGIFMTENDSNDKAGYLKSNITPGFFITKSDSSNQRPGNNGPLKSSVRVGADQLNGIKITVVPYKKMKELKFYSKQRTTNIATLNPIRTQIIMEKEMFKAACCNLSESFETNPSVDVSYNDAVTGSKQIQLLGLSGNYTQLTVENLPGPRGIATPLGLNAVPGPWVESIQLIKGIGSVANGYESIAGQINIELKKPENSEQLFANAYVNNFGKTDLNLNMTQAVGKKWWTGLLLHDDLSTNRHLDFNKDGFRDLPTGNQFNMINRWKHENGKGLLVQFGIKLLIDKKTGGEVSFNPDIDKHTVNKYGLGMHTNRTEAFAKIGYVFPKKRYKSIGLQLSAINHQQDSYFGLTSYNARQKNLYANLIYQSIIRTTIHKFRTGISFLLDDYHEDFKAIRYLRTEKVPGAFFEYTFTPSEKLSLIAGIRADHNNLFGFFATPRLHVRYEPVKGTTIRVSAGRGQRTANIFAENSSVFVSGRQVQIMTHETGKAYGLNAEVAWNKGISIDQLFTLFKRQALLSVDFFRNDFRNQVVVDLEDPATVKFYDLQGSSFSNSLQADMNLEPVKKLDVKMAYRYFDVRTTFSGVLLKRPLIATNRAFINLAYAAKKGWKFDYTLNYNGRKRIPNTLSNPVAYQRAPYSPGFIIMNAQVSKTVGKKYPMDFYIGAENLTNYFQRDVIVAADRPFSMYFDASLLWGPVTGRMIYVGWRFKIMTLNTGNGKKGAGSTMMN